MKYKVGDKVRIKSLDWYNKNKNENNKVDCVDYYFVPQQRTYCGQEAIITKIQDDGLSYSINLDYYNNHHWTDDMFEDCIEVDKKWEERRYEISKAIMQSFLSSTNFLQITTEEKYDKIVNATMILTDNLIKKLNKKI